MRFSDRQKRDIEEFKKILPLINRLILKVQLTNKPVKYQFNNVDFLIRLNDDIIEISLAEEAPIFPTLAFREFSNTRIDLLYYRIGDNFRSALNNTI
jgi:hypothetical protein